MHRNGSIEINTHLQPRESKLTDASVSQLVSDLPGHSKNRVELTNQFLDELWNSLPHPPLS